MEYGPQWYHFGRKNSFILFQKKTRVQFQLIRALGPETYTQP